MSDSCAVATPSTADEKTVAHHEQRCMAVGLHAGATQTDDFMLPPCCLQAVLQDQKDTTQIRLLYANKTPDDILLKDQLDEMAQKSGGRFQVCKDQ